MPLYSLKVQTLVASWKLFHSSGSAIFVDDAVAQWLLYCVCGHKKRCDQLFGFCGPKGQLQLKFITGDEIWVHQYYPETQAQSMTWKHPHSSTIKKFKTSTISGKVMATVFWDMHGVLLHFSPPNETVNSAAYQATLKKLNLYRTRSPSVVRPFKFPWYEGIHHGALQPLKWTVHSCRGLEL